MKKSYYCIRDYVSFAPRMAFAVIGPIPLDESNVPAMMDNYVRVLVTCTNSCQSTARGGL